VTVEIHCAAGCKMQPVVIDPGGLTRGSQSTPSPAGLNEGRLQHPPAPQSNVLGGFFPHHRSLHRRHMAHTARRRRMRWDSGGVSVTPAVPGILPGTPDGSTRLNKPRAPRTIDAVGEDADGGGRDAHPTRVPPPAVLARSTDPEDWRNRRAGEWNAVGIRDIRHALPGGSFVKIRRLL
jgi:hypothetical protein